ncbi:hypothetical protein SAMN05421663_105208 [Terribacillus halophilus]|uniref:Small multi-drug export protein n=1 Tax=Terribacillus halophilus TaxID=361279 RepID=A0A1G6QSW3_9BACI|nr:hypothetical protein [Terribacillus halophilus]SDC95450.1 hypothetical protein SAMN05421663_105208 [Terribacillus halophilus]
MLSDVLDYLSSLPLFFLYLSLILLSAVPFVEAHITVPLGIMLGLPFPVCCLIGLTANFLSVVLAVKWMKSTKKDNYSSIRMNKAKVLGTRYGVPALALMGPILGANHISAAAAVLLGASIRSIYFWQLVSIGIWGIGTGLLVQHGISFFKEGSF